MAETEGRAQIVYFSHGGGPLPLLGDPGHFSMIEFMKALPARLRRPTAVLVVSAHWEEGEPTLLSSDRPPMLYDYYGFPDKAYEIVYPAPGSPELARRIAGLLGDSGLPARMDSDRGFDHGLFIPLAMMYPEAEIPCLQLSLVGGLSPGAHIALGRALRGLLGEDILVIGSGFSFHNMRAFDWSSSNQPDPRNDAFQAWLVDTCTGARDEAERERLLSAWEGAPSARYCHPREEHLLPLHVCAGMAGGPAELVFDDYILGKRAVAFLWA
ncbi:MAG TPA: class III extradiol ring-cleavage dioxygenase [Rectinemataceae bacterium]|nr:class III extradiol ring-cleavage dioxygenase [Rectinemataceae bacterium]